MIASVFLACALSAPSVAGFVPKGFTHARIKLVNEIVQMIRSNPNQAMIDHIRVQLQKFPRHHSRLGMEGTDMAVTLKILGKVLVIGGDPIHVRTMRQYGMNAFGALTQDFTGVTKVHAVANPGSVSFLSNQFQVVFWHHIWILSPERHLAWFRDAVRLVEDEGYFIFNEERYPYWTVLLKEMGWIEIPHPSSLFDYQLSIWKKPTFVKKLAKILFWKTQKQFVPEAMATSA